MTASALILHFLAYVKEARAERIERYLALEWGVPPRTTRNVLSRLRKQGHIIRVISKTYRIGAPPAELETKPTALTTH